MEDYRTIAGRSTAEVEEKHSRFIARSAFAAAFSALRTALPKTGFARSSAVN